jgi:methyl-accepting chemotaxis protein
MKNMNISITKKIILLAVIPLMVVVLVSSLASAVLLGSNIKNEVVKKLQLATYAIQKETEQMSAENTKMEAVEELLNDFKETNGIDITIFARNIRMFSTVSDAVGTPLDDAIWNVLQGGDFYFSKTAYVNGIKYYAYYIPIMQNGECVGAFFAGEPAERVDGMIIQSMLNMIIMSMCMGAVAIVIAVIVARKIAKKIDSLKDVLETLSDNNLTDKHTKYGFEHDEIESVHNGTIEFAAQLGAIVLKIKGTLNGLKDVASELREATKVTSQTSDEVSKAIEGIADGAVSQATDTTNATCRVSEISENLHSIKNSVDELHSISNSMDEAKNNALNTLAELQKSNSVMTNEIDSTNTQVNVTSESVKQIKKAVEMIQDIADQTKLLSLNASIEASHAGERGKGFTVVAQEIGKLASQSSASSGEIENILEALAKNYALIIESVKNTTSNMTMQNEKLAETQKVFTVLESDINGTIERIISINAMVDSLNEEIGVIVDMISNLSAISQENSASTEEIMASIEEMNATISQVYEKAQNVDSSADELMAEVEVFKTE